jgi:hypothetical protein
METVSNRKLRFFPICASANVCLSSESDKEELKSVGNSAFFGILAIGVTCCCCFFVGKKILPSRGGGGGSNEDGGMRMSKLGEAGDSC